MKLRIYTMVFGDTFFDYWKRAGAASLMWPKNRAALDDVDEVLWDIYIDKGRERELRLYIATLPFATRINVIENTKDMASLTLVKVLAEAVAAGETLLMAPPDLIFGEGSVNTLLKLVALAPGRAIAVPHVRVAATKFLSTFDGEPLSNAQLVRQSFAALHESFLGAQAPARATNTRTTGVSWTELSTDLYAAAFFLPSIHCVRPQAEDVKWFADHPGPDHWDHRFPASLVGRDRHRVVGSSDAAFMAELTNDGAKHPPRLQGVPGAWDAYAGKLAHHIENRNTLSIFRGSL